MHSFVRGAKNKSVIAGQKKFTQDGFVGLLREAANSPPAFAIRTVNTKTGTRPGMPSSKHFPSGICH